MTDHTSSLSTRRTLPSYGLALLCVLAGCSDSPTPAQPAGPPTARVLTASSSDTVGAKGTGAISVLVSDAGGRPLAGAAVTFRVVPDLLFPRVPGVRIVGAASDTSVVRSTAANGQATITLDFGDRAGVFAVAVSTERALTADTVLFTVSPGKAVQMQLATRDTMLMLGSTYTPNVRTVDRLGNPRADPFVVSPVGACTATSQTITAASLSSDFRGSCVVTVQSQGFSSTIDIQVVPNAKVLTTEFTGGPLWLVSMNLDGSNYKRIGALRGGNYGSVYPAPQRGPGGIIAATDVGSDNKMHIVLMSPSGTTTQLPVSFPFPAEQMGPRFSADGTWIYFDNCPSLGFDCQVWRARLDGSLATPLTERHGYGSLQTNFALTPDQSKLLYVDTGSRVHSVVIASGVDTPLPVYGRPVAIDPAGTRLALSVAPGDKLQVSNLDGSGARTILPDKYVDNYALEWLSDGQWIIHHPFDYGQYEPSLFIVNVADGTHIKLRYKVNVREILMDR